MSRLKNIFDQQRQPVPLGKLLGRGGEGAVFEIIGAPDIVAKIYHVDKAQERQQKIAAMITSGIQARVPNAAFPISSLFDSTGTFAGFAMQRVGKQKPVHQLYSPASRRNEFPNADYRLLLRTALNIAKAVGAVHAAGCVIGDLNHSGILVGADATATLIDCDSFQFSKDGRTYYCAVGVPDYTPPELQGKSLANICRTQNHDAFGLGVAIFSLLFLGRHPFSGRYFGRGDMPEERAIAEYRFAYSSDRSRTQTEPPPFAPTLSYVPQELAAAFEACFGPAGSNNGRPKPAHWLSLLRSSEPQLIKCNTTAAHFYFSSAPNCPWCRLEKAVPGFLAFPSPLVINTATPPDLGQLIAAIRGVGDPGAAPPLNSAMPAGQGTPSVQNRGALDSSAGQFLLSTFGGIAATALLRLGYFPPIIGLGALGASAYFALRNPKGQHANSPRAHQLKQAWDQIDLRYRSDGDTSRFNEARRQSELRIREYHDLPNDESRRLADLSRRHREIQLGHFLERFSLIDAKIRGVGNGRKATLRSYGIDTAADVARQRIEQIPGFGPATAGLVVSWRLELERRFVFNPNQPINPGDIAQVKSDIVQKRLALEGALKADLIAIRTVAAEIQRSRTDLTNRARAVWVDLKQAEADEKVRVFGDVTARRWVFGVACIAALIVAGANTGGPTPATVPPISASTENAADATPPKPNALPGPNNNPPSVAMSDTPVGQATRSPQASAPMQEAASSSVVAGANTGGPTAGTLPKPRASPGPNNNLPNVAMSDTPVEQVTRSPQASIPMQQTASSSTQQLDKNVFDTTVAPPSLPFDLPRDIKPAVQPTAEAGGSTPHAPIDPPATPAAMMGRLRELGFSGESDVPWNAGALAGLREFKIVNHLPADSRLDAETVQALHSSQALARRQSFLGGWGTDPTCSEGSQLIISSREARTEAGACLFDTFLPSRLGWTVRGRCQVGTDRWTATINFVVAGRSLSWSSAKGNTKYYRCE